MGKIFMFALMVLSVACSRYQLTFNDKTLYSPPTIYSAYSVPDRSLYNCLSQTISDKNITRAEQLKTLNCAYAGITDLTGLTHFTSLETVNLANNRITDIKPLMFLGQLKNINLEANVSLPCNDLKALQELLPGVLKHPKACIK